MISRVQVATDPGADQPNEDHHIVVGDHAVVVIDGQTARTGTGCRHGVAWYTRQLGAAIAWALRDPGRGLRDVAAEAISLTAAAHPSCDLSNPGTPSAVLGIARRVDAGVEWLLLGDVTMVARAGGRVVVERDTRVDEATRVERQRAVTLPVGSPEREQALVLMKRAEHRARNREGGFWCASTDAAAAMHARSGTVADVSEVVLLSDGAARLVDFGLVDWPGVFDLLRQGGPGEVIRRVRAAEATDRGMVRWPRTKASDDATVVWWC